MFEISSAYPELNAYYGLLVGLCYTLPYSVSGLYAGSLTKNGNRKLMMMAVIAAISCCQLTTGIVDSFLVLAVLRFLHGTISSAINPLAFSLVADFFPPDKRGTANAVLSSANFVGIALSSMTILLIKAVGWRASYMTMGAIGLIGAAGMSILKNPRRGRFDPVLSEEEQAKKDAEKAEKEANKPKGFKGFITHMGEVMENPVCKNIFIAGFIRSLASVIVTAFVPVFFQKVFPAFKSQYAVLNAAALTCFGFSSSLIGGIISDKFEKKSYMTKANIVMAGNFIAVPLCGIACFAGNFYLAMACFALKILVSGSYFSPAITMMQNTTASSDSGFVVSCYMFFAHLAQTVSPLIFSFLAKSMGAVANPRIYGYLLFGAVALGYLGSNIFYWKAGRAYTDFMTARDEKEAKEQAAIQGA